ncbi:hypothetical protein Hanom_Chr16g01488771 [Helianthus anomalus]
MAVGNNIRKTGNRWRGWMRRSWGARWHWIISNLTHSRVSSITVFLLVVVIVWCTLPKRMVGIQHVLVVGKHCVIMKNKCRDFG